MTNFYTLIKYFWVLAFVAVVFSIAYELDHYWRLGICLVMILVFSVADGLMNDRKLVSKKVNQDV